MKPNNLPEFKALIERYESITIEEIENNWDTFYYKPGMACAQMLTGFGSTSKCTLCKSVSMDCSKCAWFFSKTGEEYDKEEDYPCVSRQNYKSYDLIYESTSPSELLTAFRNRAEHMRKHIKKLGL